MTSIFLSLFLSLAFSLAHCDEGDCHVVNCSVDRLGWQRTEGSLQSTASEELRPLV